MGAVAAQDHQAVQLQLIIGLLHGRDFIHTVRSNLLNGFKRRPTAAQKCSTFGENTGKVIIGQESKFSVNQPLITVQKSVDFHFLRGVIQGFGHTAHGGVQRLTIAAAG